MGKKREMRITPGQGKNMYYKIKKRVDNKFNV
jgi:putative component of toxin-antitoxin plasmid stabilization module